jgi:adenine/guanine phosphoribosyltransferase-like PRPP-binding protein
MPDYTSNNTLRIAKRFQNLKRPYLLVNPLQAKHIPVQPAAALDMMGTLGDLLARNYPETRLVIGFAETATAIGAVVAERIAPECVYVHTTREAFPEAGHWIEFLEEHSHAVEQKLRGDRLPEWLANTDCVILVDDEISTGKTLMNMVRELREQYPAFSEKKIVAASILNRVSPENEARMKQAGIESAYLVKLPQEDYAAQVEAIAVREADAVESRNESFHHARLSCDALKDPRLGLPICDYQQSCMQMAETFCRQMLGGISPGARVLVLGTEECMYPALMLGKVLEQKGIGGCVRCHATTRSPIGICTQEGYPIFSGSKIPSFYEENRTTYIYDTDAYDVVMVVSDTPAAGTKALAGLLAAFPLREDTQVFYVQGGQDVWYL